jgi:D-serine deaminase-like pyridoxal phosphate-dependent protein
MAQPIFNQLPDYPMLLVSALPTPSVLVDRRRLLANIDRVQALADRAGARLRPHAKTHKSPAIARWQIERGAVGVCCAKMGEAEVFAAAGIDNIRLPYPVHPVNAARMVALTDRASMSIVVDHLDVARGWSDAMVRAKRRLDVLVKVDVGFHRCGIEPDAPGTLEFLRTVASLPGVRVTGLLSHAGHAYLASSEDELRRIAAQEADILLGLRDRALRAGIALDELSVGSTPTLRFAPDQKGITELRPGTYVYFDRTQVALGAATLSDCALTVLARVVSKPAYDRLVLDCGSKMLTSDPARGFGAVTGFGAVLTPEGSSVEEALTIERVSEEHAVVRVRGLTTIEPGDLVRVLPNHSCVVVNMVDDIALVEDDGGVAMLAVEARGRTT